MGSPLFSHPHGNDYTTDACGQQQRREHHPVSVPCRDCPVLLFTIWRPLQISINICRCLPSKI